MREEVKIKVTHPCPICGKRHTLIVPFVEYRRYEDGADPAVAFTSLGHNDIIRFKTHKCLECIEGDM